MFFLRKNYCFYLVNNLMPPNDNYIDLGNVDYEHPYSVVNITDQYEGIF